MVDALSRGRRRAGGVAMLILGIESATLQVGCAIGGHEGVIALFESIKGRRHAETEELAKARAESVAHLPKPPAADSRSEDGPTAPPAVEDQRFPPREEEDVAQNSKVAEEAIDVAALPAPPQETTGSGFSAAGPRDVFSVFQEGVMQAKEIVIHALKGIALAALAPALVALVKWVLGSAGLCGF